VLTDRLSTYLIPTVLDVPPRVDTIIVETPDPNGPWGARGMGEMPYLPLAAAIANAVYDATGVRFYEFPLTPERVWRGLRSRQRNAASAAAEVSAPSSRTIPLEDAGKRS
jgi:CO/xanthine dehydrogenase Mo-binding subunit